MPRANREGEFFTQDVQNAAHRRQKGLCALCGTSVAWMYSPAHAIHPPQAHQGGGDDWRHGLDNCVVLCGSCYGWTKDENTYPVSAPTPPEDFKFSHGHLYGGHRVWVNRMMGRS